MSYVDRRISTRPSLYVPERITILYHLALAMWDSPTDEVFDQGGFKKVLECHFPDKRLNHCIRVYG
jgi:hypothetical protein